MTDQSEWWCALCPTSHPSRAALDKHTVAVHPTTTGSTSAQLRQTQTALAASQADLTRVERERDELAAEVELLTEAMPCGWCAGVGVAPAERFGRDADGAPWADEDRPCPEGCEVADWLRAERNDAGDVEKERDLARAELASANAELDRWRAGAQPDTEGAPA